MGRLLFSLFNGLQSSSLVPTGLRMVLLRLSGMTCEPGAAVYEHTFFGSAKTRLRADCFVSVNCLFDGSDWIEIGPATHLAPGVQLLTSSHEIGPREKRAGALHCAPVTIGAGCWLGAGVLVMPGVAIADGCVIAAGAVLTQSTEPDGLYAGLPAKRIRDLDGPKVAKAPLESLS